VSRAAAAGGGPRVDRLDVSVYTVPTEMPESDGTLEWESTTMVLVEAGGGGERGLGYSYTHGSAALLVRDLLAPHVVGAPVMDVPRAREAMLRAVRNVGSPGLASTAIAAVDAALWDLKAKHLRVPLAALLGAVRDAVPVYGSGGFTSYDEHTLRDRLAGWAEQGIRWVKMKVGRDAGHDVRRVRAARDAIGPGTGLFVDANGAYTRKVALRLALAFADHDVTWFEEPVSSDDLAGLRLLRDRAPAGMEIAAGEYGYDADYFRRMLEAGAVDVLMPDATRCAGISGFLEAGALCRAFAVPLSAHTAPALHLAPCCALPEARHLEYFHDHVRIEAMLFDGVPRPVDGSLRPDPSRPGLGLELKRADAERWKQ
jgi:L-alanine-DL-glutamate epimerase-like enolase superfamily enzyme